MDDTKGKAVFTETTTNALDPNLREMLSRRINELSLKIQGTPLEAQIQKLYYELESRGITFKPKCYLSDEWGCPHGIPVIGIPFYLADPQLAQLEGRLTGIEAENEMETLMYLRHEAGHAFNYAHKLYLQSEWRSIFGLFSRPYKDDYKPKPFSPHFVRHIPGWYAQKHPDEDFAETFAVWLTTGSDWRRTYDDTPALTKLLFVDRIVQEYGKSQPIVTDESLDTPIEELDDTLNDWYETNKYHRTITLPSIVNEDLRRLFAPFGTHIRATVFLNANRSNLAHQINFWTGIDREHIEGLIDEIIRRANVLGCTYDESKEKELLIAVSSFINTLVMNHLYTDSFVLL